MSFKACALSILLTLGVALSPKALQAQDTVWVDEILVTVNGQALTASNVYLLQAYLQVAEGRGMGRPIEGWATISVTQTLRILEEDSIMLSISSRLSRTTISPQRIEEQVLWFRSLFESPETYQDFVDRWGFDVLRQRAFFGERLRVSDFIDVKVGAFAAPPETELQSYLANHQQYYGTSKLGEVRKQLTADYAKYRRGERYGQWIEHYMSNHSDAVRVPSQKLPTEHGIP